MSLPAETRWRLRDGTRIDPVGSLPASVRARLADPESSGFDEVSDDGVVLSRRGARTFPVLLDEDAAALVERFSETDERPGVTVAEAVLALAKDRGVDAMELLDASLPLVERLVARGYLVDAERPPRPLDFRRGDVFDGDATTWRIAETLARQEDGEVHLVRAVGGAVWGVLKISTAERFFGRPEPEAEVLRHLEAGDASGVVSGLLDAKLGSSDPSENEMRWIVLEHVAGVDIETAAAGLRRIDERSALLALCRQVADAFVRLHGAGVVHGDVHPDNVLVERGLVERSLVEPSVVIRLVDLGCARFLDRPPPTKIRGGVDPYREPEQAAAILAGDTAPPASAPGEQHAVAVLLFRLVTGHHPIDLAVDRNEMLRQIIDEPPRVFAEIGATPWPQLEEILRRALAKDPANRFGSMADFAAALRRVEVPGAQAAQGVEPKLRRAARRVERSASFDLDARGGWLQAARENPSPETLYFGTAGLAWGLLHAAVRRGDGALLAAADVWATRALQRDAASVDPAGDSRPTAPLHGPAGVHETAACVAWTRGDLPLFARHARAFVDASASLVKGQHDAIDADQDLDLALGVPGTLVSAAHLVDRTEGMKRLADVRTELLSFGDALLAGWWDRVSRRPGAADADGWLGMAHGWAGALYAALVWCRSARRDVPSGLADRLDELLDCAVPIGRGLRWPWSRERGITGRVATMAGWCHGGAGYQLLYATAASFEGSWPEIETDTARRARWREAADAAAWDVWDRFVRAPRQTSHLCCGLAGMAWSLLRRARDANGAERVAWVRCALAVAKAASERDDFEDPDTAFVGALFKGRGSLPALVADLDAACRALEEHGEAARIEACWPWLEDVEHRFD